jgi:Ca2+-binding RTX toxin-like protein
LLLAFCTYTNNQLINLGSRNMSNDTFLGTDDADLFQQTLGELQGNDTYDGLGDFDTVDYLNLNAGITLKPRGEVVKNGIGTDRLIDIEEIIGNANYVNSIDASTATSPDSFIVANLSANSLNIFTPGFPSEEPFVVQNFVNVTGAGGGDTIIGNAKNNVLTGGNGNDVLAGQAGNDIVTGNAGNDVLLGGSGVDQLTGTDARSRGVGEADILTGGKGGDKFVLGDHGGSYYLGNGNNDFASIRDFASTDNLVLGELGRNQSYVRQATGDGFNLFIKSRNRFTSSFDLVAQVKRDQVNGQKVGDALAVDSTDDITVKEAQSLPADFSAPQIDLSIFESGIAPGVKTLQSDFSQELSPSAGINQADPNNFDSLNSKGLLEFTLTAGQTLGNFTAV